MKREKKDQTELRRDEVPFVHFLLYRVFLNFLKLYLVEMPTSERRSEEKKKKLLDSAKKCKTVTNFFW